MCGRFDQHANPEEIAEHFGVSTLDLIEPRYNVAPSQPVLIVRAGGGGREMAHVHWGLVPSWSKQWPSRPMINARGESVAEKPSFRSAFKRRRCLIPATGYYEWQRRKKGPKQPFLFRPAGGGVMALGGIWETWAGPEGEEADTAAIITTSPNWMASQVHDRMPLILQPSLFDRWLDHTGERTDHVRELIQPAPEDFLEAVAVSTHVNNPRNDDPRCLQPAE